MEWNLNELFANIDEAYNEILNLKKEIAIFEADCKEPIDYMNIGDLLHRRWTIKEQTDKILLFSSLVYYKNVFNDETIKIKKEAEEFSIAVQTILDLFDKKMVNLGYEKVMVLLKENGLEKYAFYVEELFRLRIHTPLDNDLNNLIKNDIQKQLDIYNYELKNMEFGTIKIDGVEEKITSSNYVSIMISLNREVRREAFLQVNKSYGDKSNVFARILDKIFGLRIKLSINEKYNSVLESTLTKDNMDKNVISSLISSVQENICILQNYLNLKSKFLGIKRPHLYDFGVPLTRDLNINYTWEEAVEIVKKSLKPLGKDYIKVVDLLLNGHIDSLEDAKKHQSITFSWNTYSFMNFRGKYVDLKNLIHEIGHIVNYYFSKNKVDYMYEDSTVFVGETASTINEILLNRYLYENAKNEEEKLFYLSKEIENFFTSVFKQTMYTELENTLYDVKCNENLDEKNISAAYYAIINKYYGDSVVYDKESCFEWCRLGHIFRWSFYNYKYATGLLIASNVVNSLVDKKTLKLENYIEFLSLGSSKSPKDLLGVLDIDLSDKNIITNGFEILKRDIDKIELLENIGDKK